MREFFGGAADGWEWQEHVSAEPLRRRERRGQARVEVIGGREERLGRLVGLLEELGVGRRAMTCGVLVRRNREVREVADLLRAEGFDVIEEGRRQPALDNPVGVALLHLLKWLADPSDAYAVEVVAMSPLLERVTGKAEGGMELRLWAELTERAAEAGFAGVVGEIVEACQEEWSDFGRRRAGDVIAALAELDARGGATPREAAAWVERLEISQSPGAAAVQVMTIHKSKGLGFDVVVLPEVPDDLVPETQRFTVAEGPGWIAQTPPKWARDCLPAMREAEARWAAAQRYEGFCMLYVALTRAKRGLYVLLDESKGESGKPSLANWLARSVGAGAMGVAFESGRGDWVEGVAGLEERREEAVAPVLGAATARRDRSTPSGEKAGVSGRMAGSAEGMRLGREVHAAFERVGWLDEGGEAPEAVRELLEEPEIRAVFERRGRRVELFREQPVEAVFEGRWLSGVIDRLHVFRDGEGRVEGVELIDFKTDAVERAEVLAGRYAGQMAAYREVLAKAFGGAPVRCLLLAVRMGRWVEAG